MAPLDTCTDWPNVETDMKAWKEWAMNDPFTAEAYIRKPLLDFAYDMEDKLRKNDHKKGWRELPIEALFKLLMIEIEEFKVAHEFFEADAARSELIDIANFAMMLSDRLGMEDAK